MLLAADFSLMCRLPSASVLIGQEAVITKPALTKPLARASQRAARLVGKHDRHHAVRFDHSAALSEDGGHPFLVVAGCKNPRSEPLAFEFRGVCDGFTILISQVVGEGLREIANQRCA